MVKDTQQAIQQQTHLVSFQTYYIAHYRRLVIAAHKGQFLYWWLEMVQNHLHKLNRYLKIMIFSYNLCKKGPVKRVTSKSKIVYIIVLIDFKYQVAIAINWRSSLLVLLIIISKVNSLCIRTVWQKILPAKIFWIQLDHSSELRICHEKDPVGFEIY